MDARPSGSQSAHRREASSPGASIPDKSPRRRGDEGLHSTLIGRARENDPGSTRDTQVTTKPGTLRPNVSFPEASLGGRRKSAVFVTPADWPKGETEHEPHAPERKVPRCESLDTHNAGKPDHHQDHGISPRTEDKNFQRLLGGFMVALFVGLSLLVLGVLFSLHIVRGAPLTLTPGPWCTSDGCLQQAGYLQRSANTSVQPCQDFYSFVCQNWAPNRNSHQVEYIADVPTEMRNHWRLKNAALLFNGSLGPPSFKRASVVFKACILRTEKDKTSDLENFKKIMRDAGIPWPDDPSSEKHPLAVLLDLDANWGAPVWFKVRVQGDLGSPRVVIEPNYLYDALYKDLGKPTIIKRMAEFHQMYGTQRNTTELEESADLDMLIASSLRDSLENRENNPQLTSIGDLHHITPDINSSYWLSLFNHHFEQALLENNDAILVQNAQLLSSITFFVGNISNKKMLRVIGWWFAQLYTSVADVRALRIIFGALDKDLLGAVCLHQIKQRYGAAVLTGYVGSQFTQEHQTAIERVLNSVQIQLTNNLRSVNWTAETRREEMLKKVNSTRIDIWPSPAFEGTFNKTFPKAPSSYFDFWATRTKSLREQKASQKKRRNDINLLPGYTDPMFSYDQWENAVSISLATLSPPWYYKDGSAAIIYGTLGWNFARTLSMAIVSTKKPLPPKPQQPSQSLDPADGRCGDPGLEVAFQAYAQDSHHRSEGGLVLHNTSYSPDQVFFLSLARGICGLPAAPMNDMLKNFKPFAEAFECDSNSTMGGQRHCTFF